MTDPDPYQPQITVAGAVLIFLILCILGAR